MINFTVAVNLSGCVVIGAFTTRSNRSKLRMTDKLLRTTIFASILHILLLKVRTKLFLVVIVAVLEISLKTILNRELFSASTSHSVVGRQNGILSTIGFLWCTIPIQADPHTFIERVGMRMVIGIQCILPTSSIPMTVDRLLKRNLTMMRTTINHLYHPTL